MHAFPEEALLSGRSLRGAFVLQLAEKEVDLVLGVQKLVILRLCLADSGPPQEGKQCALGRR